MEKLQVFRTLDHKISVDLAEDGKCGIKLEVAWLHCSLFRNDHTINVFFFPINNCFSSSAVTQYVFENLSQYCPDAPATLPLSVHLTLMMFNGTIALSTSGNRTTYQY